MDNEQFADGYGANHIAPQGQAADAPAVSEGEGAMRIAPEGANGAAPLPRISTKQRAGATAPERATIVTPAGQGPAIRRRARKGRAGTPAEASAAAPAPAKPSKQRATIGAPEMADLATPAAQGPANATAPETAIKNTPDPATICAELIALQRQRRFCIRMQSRIDRGLEATLARQLGYHTKLQPPERKAIFRRVAILREAIVTEDQLAVLSEQERAVASVWLPLILQTEASRIGWDTQRSKIETAMRDLARQLPVWEWAASIRGFAPLGLAIIVGEACGPDAPELGDFRSHQNLCKRLGLGVVDGHRQGSPGKDASADDWIREGYSRERRAEIWTILDYSLRNAQWRNEKEGVREAGPLGSYGAIYARQVAAYEDRGWPHAKKAAARFMAKALIRDLWRAWRRYEGFAEGEGARERTPKGQNLAAPTLGEAAGIIDGEEAIKFAPEGRKLRASPVGEGI